MLEPFSAPDESNCVIRIEFDQPERKNPQVRQNPFRRRLGLTNQRASRSRSREQKLRTVRAIFVKYKLGVYYDEGLLYVSHVVQSRLFHDQFIGRVEYHAIFLFQHQAELAPVPLLRSIVGHGDFRRSGHSQRALCEIGAGSCKGSLFGFPCKRITVYFGEHSVSLT